MSAARDRPGAAALRPPYGWAGGGGTAGGGPGAMGGTAGGGATGAGTAGGGVAAVCAVGGGGPGAGDGIAPGGGTCAGPAGPAGSVRPSFISSAMLPVAFRRSPSHLPMLRPIAGRRFGPTKIRATAAISRSFSGLKMPSNMGTSRLSLELLSYPYPAAGGAVPAASPAAAGVASGPPDSPGPPSSEPPAPGPPSGSPPPPPPPRIRLATRSSNARPTVALTAGRVF